MSRMKNLITAAGLGAVAMYFLDPERGQQRRQVVKQRTDKLSKEVNHFWDATSRDISNRVVGLKYELQHAADDEPIPDDILEQRVRSRIGHAVANPRTIEVTAHEGKITLSGTALEREMDRLIAAVWATRGVFGVENQMEVVPVPDIEKIAPSSSDDLTRNTCSLAGSALMLAGLKRRGKLRAGLALAGGVLLARGLWQEGKGLTGSDVTAENVILIDAPQDEVFALLADFRQYAQFLPGIESVEDLGAGRFQWNAHLERAEVVVLNLKWVTVVEEVIPGERISFRGEDGSSFMESGCFELQPGPAGATQVTGRLKYRLPGGQFAQMAAAAVGFDAGSILQSGLRNMKTTLEARFGKKITGPLEPLA